MILGHEASGVVVETGTEVTGVGLGDRVCMEPGVPDPASRVSRLGFYNLDPAVRFWATPPVHGVMRPTVVHPADFTFKLPDNVSFAEGAMVEPLAVGMHAVNNAGVRPGDTAAVIGAGTIGLVTILAAIAGGCGHVIVTDVKQPRLDLAGRFGPVMTVNVEREDPLAQVQKLTDGWGVDIVFEASGNPAAVQLGLDMLRPRGTLICIGMSSGPVPFDVVKAQAKEITIRTIFRYAHVYPRALNLMAAGKIDLKPLITETYPFDKSVQAYDYAVSPRPTSVKVQVELPE